MGNVTRKQAAEAILARAQEFPQEVLDKASAVLAAEKAPAGSPRMGEVVSVVRPRVVDTGTPDKPKTEKVFVTHSAKSPKTSSGAEQGLISKASPYAAQEAKNLESQAAEAEARSAAVSHAPKPVSVDDQFHDYSYTPDEQEVTRSVAAARGWDMDPLGNPINPHLAWVTPEGQEYTPEQLQALPEIEAQDVYMRGSMVEKPPPVETRSRTSGGSFLTQRIFHEPTAEQAAKALRDPEIRRLAVLPEDLVVDSRNVPSLPAHVEEGSPLHARIADAVWTKLYRQDEQSGARLIRAKTANLSLLEKAQAFADPLGAFLLEMDRGASGGILQSGLGVLASQVTGQDEVERLAATREQFEQQNPKTALGAQMLGAVSPNSIGSMAARYGSKALGSMGMGAMMPGTVAGNAAIGAGVGMAEQGAMALHDTAVEGQLPPDAGANIAGGAFIGAGSGALLGLAAKGLGKLAQRAEANNPDLNRLSRGGGRVHGPLVQVPKHLDDYDAQAAVMRRSGEERTGLGLATQNAADNVYRTIGNTQEGLARRHSTEAAESYAASGGQRANTNAWVQALSRNIGKLDSALVGDSKPLVDVLKRTMSAQRVASGLRHPGAVSEAQARKLFGDALDEMVSQGADPRMLTGGPPVAGAAPPGAPMGATGDPMLGQGAAMMPPGAMVPGPGQARQVFPGPAMSSPSLGAGPSSYYGPVAGKRPGLDPGAERFDIVFKPKSITLQELEDTLSEISKRTKFGADTPSGVHAEFFKELYGEGMALRGQFSRNEAMNQVARKYGATNYADLKARQSQELTQIEAMRKGAGLSKETAIPGGFEEVRLRPEQTTVNADTWWSGDETPAMLANNKTMYTQQANRVAEAVRKTPDYALFNSYANGAASKVNELQHLGPEAFRARHGQAFLDEIQGKSAEMTKALDRAIAGGNTYEGPLYRGSMVPKEKLDRWIKDGGFQTETVTSATISPPLAGGYLVDHVKSPTGRPMSTVIFHFAPGTKSVPIGGEPQWGTLKPPPRAANMGIKTEKEALIPAGKNFRVTQYAVADDGTTHLWLGPTAKAGRLRYTKGQSISRLLEQRGGAGEVQKLRAAILGRGDKDAESSEMLFKMVSDLDPQTAQALTEVLTMQAAQRLRSGAEDALVAGLQRAQGVMGSGAVAKSLRSAALTGYSGLQAASAPLERGINWKAMARVKERNQSLWEYLTDYGARNTRSASGYPAERGGRMSLANGAGARAPAMIDSERLLQAWEASKLLLESLMELPEPPGEDYGPPPPPAKESRAKQPVRDTIDRDAGAP